MIGWFVFEKDTLWEENSSQEDRCWGGRSPRQGTSGILSGCPEQGMSSICLQGRCESIRFMEVRNTVNNNRPTCLLLSDKGDFTRFKFIFSPLIYLFWQNYSEVFLQCPFISGRSVDFHLQWQSPLSAERNSSWVFALRHTSSIIRYKGAYHRGRW